MSTVFPGPEDVGGTRDAVQRGLAGAVAIVKEVLGVSIIHGDDGVHELALLREAAEANNAGCGLFAAAAEALDKILPLTMNGCDEVCAVVHCDGGVAVKRLVDVLVVRLRVLTVDGENGDAVIGDERCGNIVLRRERVGRAQANLRATLLEGEHEVGRF